MTVTSSSDGTSKIKQANETRQESEAKYRSLFELAHDVILRLDRAGNILDINRRAELLTDYPQSDLQQMNVFDHLIIPEDHSIIRQVIQNTFEGKDSEYEVHWRTKKGTIIHFDGATVPWRSANGEILSTLCTLRDITRQRQAERELRESEEKYRGLFEGSDDAIIVADTKTGRHVDCNRKAEELTGYSRSELLSMKLAQLSSDDLAQKVFEGLEQVFSAEGGVSGEWEIQTKAKRSVPVEISSKIVTIGGLSFYQSIFRDISDRKKAEEALRESEELHRIILSNISDAVFITDLGGAFAYICPNVDVIFGYTPTEVKAFGNIREILGEHFFSLDELGVKREIRNLERQITSKTGEGHDLLVNVKLVSIWDDGVLVTCRDITERKRVEEDRARLLETEHQAREELAALATHLAEAQETERKRLARELHDQIGQKLTGLGINLNIVRMEAGMVMTPPIRSRLDESLALVEETAERIRDVSLELRPAVLDDYGLAAALRWYGEQYAKRTHTSVEVDAKDLIPRLSLEKETALFRIAQQALTNVTRHARANKVRITVEASSGSVTLIVADDGEGFDVDAVHPTERTGWGLINMRERAEAIAGCLRVESNPGEGTRVIVDLTR